MEYSFNSPTGLQRFFHDVSQKGALLRSPAKGRLEDVSTLQNQIGGGCMAPRPRLYQVVARRR